MFEDCLQERSSPPVPSRSLSAMPARPSVYLNFKVATGPLSEPGRGLSSPEPFFPVFNPRVGQGSGSL